MDVNIWVYALFSAKERGSGIFRKTTCIAKKR